MAEAIPIDANALVAAIIGINGCDYGSMFDFNAHTAANGALNDVVRLIDDAPLLDYEPVRHGDWMPVDGEAPCDEWVCTNCKSVHTFCIEMDFDDMHRDFWRCPKCGAKMDGGAGND